MRAILLFLVVATSASGLEAKPVLTVTCGEPSGTRYDQVQGKVKQQSDGFSGANPVFVWDDAKPGYLTLIWGNAKWAKDAGLSADAEEAAIVFNNENMITAVLVDAFGAVKMYSLYPKKGVVFFTQHRYMNVVGGVPNSSSFHAVCAFSAK